MGARDITGPMIKALLGTVYPDVTMAHLVENITEEMASTQRDMDICGDMEDHIYYEGCMDTYMLVLSWIAPIAKMKEWCSLLSLKYDETLDIDDEVEQAA